MFKWDKGKAPKPPGTKLPADRAGTLQFLFMNYLQFYRVIPQYPRVWRYSTATSDAGSQFLPFQSTMNSALAKKSLPFSQKPLKSGLSAR